MSGGTIDNRGIFVDISVPASDVEIVKKRILSDGKYSIDPCVSQDDDVCHIRIYLVSVHDQGSLFKLLKEELHLSGEP